jgi:uncharacterized paraquat-inducible protein A
MLIKLLIPTQILPKSMTIFTNPLAQNMIGCKGKCGEHEVTKFPYHVKKYDAGFKYCSICEKWFNQKEFRCPCCNMILRTSSRNARSRRENGEKIES